MQTDLQKRILANVLIDSRPEHVLTPQRQRISMSTLVSMAFAVTAAMGLVLLLISKLQLLH
ncbi:MAG: hypothetical protein M3Q07_21050 [Pseudobdellovibrionaceae bacterium]|uniref:hypothetical protein n=1 Tax=Oligoflexus sp. TaxID=1971216 RepID=UPI0027C685A0|nr:hypothetical protein [Oligoflexus sp.]MDQ3234303.1 hypothetical protein [Pseudobdellovibrionaceae bacterium]HYX32924.1 hypothetical protein [Oligoflexus sp.]